MNAKQLLEFLNLNYKYHKASSLAKDHIINSSWREWLIAEIAIAFAHSGSPWKSKLYAPYMLNHQNCIDTHWARYSASEVPSVKIVDEITQASRCDLLLEKRDGERVYIEIVCSNQEQKQAYFYAWGQFLSRLSKIQSLKNVNPYLNIIAVLATHGSMGQAHKLYNTLSGKVDIYTWDAEHNLVTPFLKTQQSGNDRFFISAATTLTTS